MFAVVGTIADVEAKLTWADGRMRGDPEPMERVMRMVGSGQEVASTPQGPFYLAGVDLPEAALATAVAALDTVTGVFGDLPPSEGDEISDGLVIEGNE